MTEEDRKALDDMMTEKEVEPSGGRVLPFTSETKTKTPVPKKNYDLFLGSLDEIVAWFSLDEREIAIIMAYEGPQVRSRFIKKYAKGGFWNIGYSSRYGYGAMWHQGQERQPHVDKPWD